MRLTPDARLGQVTICHDRAGLTASTGPSGPSTARRNGPCRSKALATIINMMPLTTWEMGAPVKVAAGPRARCPTRPEPHADHPQPHCRATLRLVATPLDEGLPERVHDRRTGTGDGEQRQRQRRCRTG